MKVAFVGSRKGASYESIDLVMSALLTEYGEALSVVSGGADGVDTQSEEIAYAYGLDGERVTVFEAEWHRDGKFRLWAGLERNTLIVNEADLVRAWIEAGSRGTSDDVHKTLAAGKPLRMFDLDGCPWLLCPCEQPKCPVVRERKKNEQRSQETWIQ